MCGDAKISSGQGKRKDRAVAGTERRNKVTLRYRVIRYTNSGGRSRDLSCAKLTWRAAVGGNAAVLSARAREKTEVWNLEAPTAKQF